MKHRKLFLLKEDIFDAVDSVSRQDRKKIDVHFVSKPKDIKEPNIPLAETVY